jgi:hypothetical protein
MCLKRKVFCQQSRSTSKVSLQGMEPCNSHTPRKEGRGDQVQ